MNLPMSLGLIKQEMAATANWSWNMYPGLSLGCINTLLLHASDEQKQTYIPKLATGEWAGTMCLTEPHCGTDLSQVRTKAVLQPDGRCGWDLAVALSYGRERGRRAGRC